MTKDYLEGSSLTNFWDIVREAKISKEDQSILDARFVEGLSIVEISVKYNCSVEKVNKVIKKSCDKIYKLLGN